MKNTLQRSIQAYSKLIGIPYSEKDCWGIVVEFYKLVFDIELNPYYSDIPQTREEAKALVYSVMKDFNKVEGERKFGDILLIKLFGVESHIAIYLGNGQMLHTDLKTGCCIDRLARWERLLVGTYRVKEQ